MPGRNAHNVIAAPEDSPRFPISSSFLDYYIPTRDTNNSSLCMRFDASFCTTGPLAAHVSEAAVSLGERRSGLTSHKGVSWDQETPSVEQIP